MVKKRSAKKGKVAAQKWREQQAEVLLKAVSASMPGKKVTLRDVEEYAKTHDKPEGM